MSHVPHNTSAIELSNERQIVITTLKHGERKLTFRRIGREDWAAYFAAIYFATQQDGKDLIRNVETESARVTLVHRALTRAEGYRVAGDVDLMSVTNWRDLLPVEHRLLAGTLLASAQPEPESDEEDILHPEGQPVRINAVWGSDAAGNALRYSDLVHVLKAPTDAQFRRYNRAASQTRVLGGSRTGTTQYIGAGIVAAEIYDELVVSVQGYTLHGSPLSDADTIKREMDAHHKFVAAMQVLQPRNEATLKVETEEGTEA